MKQSFFIRLVVITTTFLFLVAATNITFAEPDSSPTPLDSWEGEMSFTFSQGDFVIATLPGTAQGGGLIQCEVHSQLYGEIEVSIHHELNEISSASGIYGQLVFSETDKASDSWMLSIDTADEYFPAYAVCYWKFHESPQQTPSSTIFLPTIMGK